MLRNTKDNYGLVTLSLHWIVALTVIGLFLLGLWMVDLGYYDPWRKTAPELHKAIGVLLFMTVVIRISWRQFSRPPVPIASQPAWEHRAAATTHMLLYLLLFAVMTAGYLISTADGRPIDVFGLFLVPAIVSGLPDQADKAGDIHFILAVALVSLAGIHAIAALKHHFIDRDRTLMRMLGRRTNVNGDSRHPGE